MLMTATYSPEDNKLRLYSSTRLDAETYARVKAAGFRWAPKQELFVAPAWNPTREDILIELAGEVGDEDTSLVERAEERADRFSDYSHARAADAESARKAVSAIADGIPFGQPILVGHHSEKHARRDAEKIENGMRRTIQMWETANYWRSRAAGAIRHAKYKELPAVRARRIKGLEADLRKELKDKERSEHFMKLWAPITNEDWDKARGIANYDRACSGSSFPLAEYPRLNPEASKYEGAMGLWSALEGIITPEQARDMAMRAHRNSIVWGDRWINHLTNRLAYENAMLEEGGGLIADKFNFAIGGQVLRRGKWFVVTGLNRRDGQLLSVRVVGHWTGSIQVEEITDYKEPAEGDGEKVKAATKLAPLCNWPGEGFIHIAKVDFKKHYGTWIHTFPATETHAAYRSYSKFKGGGGLDCHNRVGVFFTDQKRKDPPALKAEPKAELPTVQPSKPRTYKPVVPEATDAEFEAIKESLKAGVQVVSAPQLFPTPPELAARMVEVANIQAGDTVLEPSAGTGAIVRAVIEAVDTEIVGYEINRALVSKLDSTFPSYKLQTRCMDFLEVTDGLGQFPVVLMNPPFENGADIKHIQHAIEFLRPGGRLVALCANGPRQQDKLKPLAENSGGWYEPLPAGTFKAAGTGVNVAMLVYEKGNA